MINKQFLFTLILLSFLAIVESAFALTPIDEIRYEAGQSSNDVRMQFKLELLNMAMTKTKDTYGDYRIVNKAPQLNTFRAMNLMQSGESLNVFIAVTNNEWEEKTIPIRIPVRRGLLNYRLLLIYKDSMAAFEKIGSLKELLKRKVGSKHGWSSTPILTHSGFKVIKVSEYDGLFQMLDVHRFDFLPRGVNEIYDEFAQKKETLQNILIEPNLALHIPSATYVFVSPKFPKLAKRIEKGLDTMVADGSLKSLVDRYYREDLKKADLTNRKVIHIENPFLPPNTPLGRKELWIDIMDY